MAKTTRNMLLRAITVFTPNEQMRMAQEECAELIQAINKLHRAKTRREQQKALDSVIEETADVEIMCEQIRIMTDTRSVDLIKTAKLNRLKARLDKIQKEAK